jgi:hypothetical protein
MTVTKATEEVRTTMMTPITWRVCSVFISKAYFMPSKSGKGGYSSSKKSEQCAGKMNLGQWGQQSNSKGHWCELIT